MATDDGANREAPENLIEIRVNDVAQLFHTLDPFPFRDKDLDHDAEEYIVGWAREMPADRPVTIVVHLASTQAPMMTAKELAEAFNRYFAGRAVAAQHELNELFRMGRRSLAIGAPILASCLLLAHLAAGYITEATVRKMAEESFLILGWVANWRPLEIFLYDWWPLARRRDLFNRLAMATVELLPAADGGTGPTMRTKAPAGHEAS